MGSCGVFTVSLQSVLVWLLLLVAAMLSRPHLDKKAVVGVAVILTLLLAGPRSFGWSPLQLPLAVSTVLGVIAIGKRGVYRWLFFFAGTAVLAVVLFRFAQLQNPVVWMLSDRLGGQVGKATGFITGQSLHIGATFAGLDFLVVMGVFGLGCFTLARGHRLSFVLLSVICILLAQAIYLGMLAFTSHIRDVLPPVIEPTFSQPYVPPDFCWSTIARQALPWNLPAVGAILHGLATVLIIRWTPWRYHEDAGKMGATWSLQPMTTGGLLIVLGLLLPVVGILNLQRSILDGTKIVANTQDDIDYRVPRHDGYGQESAGMFGMLPAFVRDLGGEFEKISRLDPTLPRDADVLLLLHPNERFSDSKQLREYVREGGSVLLVTDGFDPEFGPDQSIERVLEGTGITVSRDAAVSETGQWQGVHMAAIHAATSRATVPASRFLSDSGASLRTGWGTRPLILGQWGWSAPEQGATWSDSPPPISGGKLGDLVLAAEQRIGAGKVVVLGGNRALTNEGLVHGYEFLGDVLAYLAHDHSGPQDLHRQAMGLLCCIAIPVLLLWRPNALWLVGLGTVLLVGVGANAAWSRHAARVLPDSGKALHSREDTASHRIQQVAYIDQSHLEAYDFEDWGFDAINGLALNLMRNGYLPLMLSRLTPDRLAGAELFISIGPSKEFTSQERDTLKSFVQRGGILICAVGGEDAAPSASLLSEFGLNVPASPVPTGGDWPEPEPFGRGKAFYLDVESPEGQNYQSAVRLHAAWPVESTDGRAEVIAYGRNQLRVVESDAVLPVILSRKFGNGTVVLIGDTDFAMNKNLEYFTGEPFSGGHENAHFWRWLITHITDRPEWIPPPPESSEAAAVTEEDG